MWRDRYKIGEWGEDENKYGEESARVTIKVTMM
jgi:hypothetical protein